MSVEVKRVPLGFAWPMNRPWFGYLADYIYLECPGPDNNCWRGKIIQKVGASDDERAAWPDCPICNGEGKHAYKQPDPPFGMGWQMWETVSEGSPISPVFDTPEELAEYMDGHGWGIHDTDAKTWLKMIRAGRSMGSMVMDIAGVRSGVVAVAEMD